MKERITLATVQHYFSDAVEIIEEADQFRVPIYGNEVAFPLTILVSKEQPVLADGSMITRWSFADHKGSVPKELGIDLSRYTSPRTVVNFGQYRDDCLEDPSIKFGEAEFRLTGPLEATDVLLMLRRREQPGEYAGCGRACSDCPNKTTLETSGEVSPGYEYGEEGVIRGVQRFKHFSGPNDMRLAVDYWIIKLDGRLHKLRLSLSEQFRHLEEAEETARRIANGESVE